MKKRIIFLIALLAGAQSLSATIWRVNNNAGVARDFATIQGAIDAASPGDTIHVEGSITPYDDNVDVDKKRITIIGPGFHLANNAETQHLKPSAKIRNFRISADSCIVAGLEQLEPPSGITLTPTPGGTVASINVHVVSAWTGFRLFINASDAKIINCKINLLVIENDKPLERISISKSWFCPGMIRTNDSEPVLYLSIINNFFRNDGGVAGSEYKVIDLHEDTGANIGNNTFYGVFRIIAQRHSHIYDNVFYATVPAQVLLSADPTNTYVGNIANVAGLGGALGIVNNERNNIVNTAQQTEALAPQWFGASGSIAVYDRYFMVTSPTSPIRQAAAARGLTELGMFCGLSPYVLSGLANIPAVYEIVMPFEVSSDGFEVTVKVKAH